MNTNPDVKIYEYDAVIVGAGLAGLAAAKELQKQENEQRSLQNFTH